MAITLDSFNFGGYRNGKITEGQIGQPIMINEFPGLKGVSIFIDKTKGRELSCSYTIDSVNESTLHSALAAIDAQQGALDGTLTLSGTFTSTHNFVTFLGYIRNGNPFYSPGGTTGFVQRGRLVFFQRKIG